MSAFIQQAGGDAAPIGAVADFAGMVEPVGWLFCFGQAIPRTGIYAQLFQMIGVTYGAGDGVLTFQLPDCRGRVTAGKDNMGGVSANRLTSPVNGDILGAAGGVENHVLATAELPPHTHVGASHVHNNPAHQHYTSTPHAHSVQLGGYYLATGYVANSGAGANYTKLINPVGSPTFGTAGAAAGWSDAGYGATQSDAGNSVQATSATGSGTAHNNVQPTVVFNKIIKYAAASVAAPAPGTGDVTGPSSSIDGEVAVFTGTSGKFIRRGTTPTYRFPRGHIGGLRISNNVTDAVNDIDIQDGECRSFANAEDILLVSGMTKRLDAPWAAGTGQGGLDLGSVTNGSYHVFVIKRVDTGVVDCLFSSSAVDPTLPTGYGYYRRIGSIIRTAGAITRFLQDGDYFYKDTPEVDISDFTIGTQQLVTLKTVPIGFRGHLIASMMAHNPSVGAWVSFTSPDLTDVSISTTVYGPYTDTSLTWSNTGYPVMFNTSGQIRLKTSSTATRVYLTVFGWIDPRGRSN